MLFDSHCHLTDQQFASDLPGVLARAAAAGVTRLVTISSNAEDAVAAQQLTRNHAGIWCTAGVPPHEAGQTQRRHLDEVADLLQEPAIVAVGETGLDYYYDNAPRSVQRRLFEHQLQLAADLGLPVIVHSREADDDTIAMIRSVEGEVLGVLHCFAGGADLLEAGIEAGWMVSFSGLITFKNYDGNDLIRTVPAQQLLVETDSPYLAPVPHRGKRNEPAFVRDVGQCAARVCGLEFEVLAALTTANALRIYGLPANAAQLPVNSAEPSA